jgi:hypothetical protein
LPFIVFAIRRATDQLSNLWLRSCGRLGRALQADVHAALTAHPALQYENWSPMSTNVQLLGALLVPQPSSVASFGRSLLPSGALPRCLVRHLVGTITLSASQRIRRHGDDETTAPRSSLSLQQHRSPLQPLNPNSTGLAL